MGDNDRGQITFYRSYFEAAQNLSAKDRTAYYDAVLRYAFLDEEPVLKGPSAAVFSVVRPILDSSRRKSEAGKKAKGVPKANTKQTESKPEANESNPEANVKQEQTESKYKNKNKIKNKCYESPYPLFARMAELVPDGVLGSALRTKLDEWMTYKHQRREDYTEQGLTALVSRLQKAQAEFGEDSVCDLITECMASNWQGIIFDKLSDRKAGDARRPAAGNAGKVQSGYYGGQTVASDWSRSAVARMMENGGDPA